MNPNIQHLLLNSTGSLVLIPQWVNNNTENASEFHLPMDYSIQKVLEMDMGGLPNYKIPTVSRTGYMPHYSVEGYVIHIEKFYETGGF